MRQNPISWNGCVRGAARCRAGHSYMDNGGHSRANACAKTRSLWKCCVRGARGAGHTYMDNLGHSRANTCANIRPLGMVVFAARRRGVARVILTRVTVIILELIHVPKPFIFGRVVFAARRDAARVILTWVIVIIPELIHEPKPDFLEVFCSRRGEERRGSSLHG